ncbi:MAG: transferrin receptor-like dimerization domain-containing protein [Chitinophagaceae bacterium]
MKKNLLLLSTSLIASLAIAQPSTLSGFSKTAADAEIATEKKFDANLEAKNVDQYIKDLSARPHHVGSAAGKAVADYILNKFKGWGYEAKIETFYVLFPTPKTRLLEMTGTRNFKAALKEPALKEDGTSNLESEQLPTYNAYSPDGDITAELVFVNFGVPADYEKLARMGIDVKGKIVIAKYGQSWRGIKPKLAQEHGAIGCIIYSDPKGDGYFQGDVYPKGPFRPENGVQRGSVADIPIYTGDPLTPGYASTKDAKRLDRKDAPDLLKIPVLPISYADALPLLESLEGPVVPEDWRGALPITYHAGPSKNKVHLKLEFNWDTKPVNDVIATMRGSEFPDEWVMRGNHHDAWVNGAADPLSGQAAMMEEARSIGEMAKTGWKPKRTIVYCAWDGEEEGLLGSTEWVEAHADELQQKVVLYINSDGNGRGFLGASGSHALETAFTEVARDVTDPQAGVSILERQRSNAIINAATVKAKKDLLAKKTFTLGALGSGSDYSPFFQHIGIPSLNLGFGGEDEGGEYHSIYDSYDMFTRFKDPGSAYGVVLAKTAGRTTLRFANAEALPFDFRSLQKTISKYAAEVMMLADDMREGTSLENEIIKGKHYTIGNNVTEPLLAPPFKDEVPFLNFSALQNAVATLEKTTTSLTDAIMANNFSADKKNALNKKLYQAEQMLLLKDGLPRRGWYRHSIYAPGFYTGYGVKTLPGIREAIEQRNWKEAQEQVELAAATINSFSAYLLAAVDGLK